MKEIILFTIVFPFLLYFSLTPMLNDLENARGKIIQGTIYKATEKAALEGYYTEENKEEIYTQLEEIGYERDEIELRLTEDMKMRGEYVEGTITAPNKYTFIFGGLISSDSEEENPPHVRSSARMSEFVN